MTKHIKLQKDYTTSCLYYQIKLPLDIEKNVPSDDSVRLLSAFVEGMELSDLYNTYGKIKKDQVSPRQLLKIVIYAGMNRIYSSRDIEKSCRRDINFMYLLEGKPSPDHATIARFISLHLSQCSSNILAEVSNILYELGEISGRHEEYFEDDIVSRFCGWLKTAFGTKSFDTNMDFIAKALGNKGDTSREVIRNYFLNDVFKGHCNTYSVTGSGKHPIYWLFDSGKQNGFKALIYMHRYDADNVGRVRTDYLHKAQKYVETAMQSAQYTLQDFCSLARRIILRKFFQTIFWIIEKNVMIKTNFIL